MPKSIKKPQVGEIDDLYGLPPGEFTPARNALIKRLRADGRREAAEEAAGARKPTMPAWAVNQLVRRKRQDVEELLSLGRELRRAQGRLVAGRDAGDVLALSGRERQIVQDLVRSAAGILGETDSRASDATLDEVAETLHAAALDEETAAAVAEGRLERRLQRQRRAIGLGLPAGGSRSPSRSTPPKRPPPAKLANARRRLEEAREVAREARGAAGVAERALRRAEAEAKQAAKAAERAAERERKAAEALDRAEQSRLGTVRLEKPAIKG